MRMNRKTLLVFYAFIVITWSQQGQSTLTFMEKIQRNSDFRACKPNKEEWSYDITDKLRGPFQWFDLGFEKCDPKNQNQSPIDINASSLKENKSLKPLVFHNYTNYKAKITIHNDGRLLYLIFEYSTLNLNEIPYMTGGMRNTDINWLLVRIVFHWPSEHTVNDEAQKMEVQFIHINLNCSSLELAGEMDDGVSIVSIMFPVYIPARVPNIQLNEMLKYIEMVRRPGVHSLDCILDLSHWIENKSGEYMAYKGSFSSPPCSPADRYILFKELEISQDQLNIILYTERKLGALLHGKPMPALPIHNNNRPVQPLGNRILNVYGEL